MILHHDTIHEVLDRRLSDPDENPIILAARVACICVTANEELCLQVLPMFGDTLILAFCDLIEYDVLLRWAIKLRYWVMIDIFLETLDDFEHEFAQLCKRFLIHYCDDPSLLSENLVIKPPEQKYCPEGWKFMTQMKHMPELTFSLNKEPVALGISRNTPKCSVVQKLKGYSDYMD